MIVFLAFVHEEDSERVGFDNLQEVFSNRGAANEWLHEFRAKSPKTSEGKPFIQEKIVSEHW